MEPLRGWSGISGEVDMKKLLLLVCLSAAALAADSRYREDFHYSYALPSGGHLSVENFNGSVDVTGWDQNTVDISGTKYADSEQNLKAIKIDVYSSGNTVRVRTIRPDGWQGWHWGGNMGAKYVIKVPRRTELDPVKSSNGGLRIEDIEANARLETSNGSVRLARVRGNFDVRTSNGGIEARETDGELTCITSNGSVHGDEVRGAFSARTSNGGVNVHVRDAASGRPVKVSTSNGGIDVQMDTPRGNDLIASTSNGSITVRLPATATANVHAATSAHDTIRSDFDVSTHGVLSKSRMEGAINGGGPRLELTTSNGSIKLLKI
jgi:hypothetical protein